MHSISGSSIAGKYERLLVVIWKPARRNSSTVAFSRLPLGIPSLSFMLAPVHRVRIVSTGLAHLPLVAFKPPEKATLVAFVTHTRADGFDLDQDRIAIAV